MVLRLIFSAKFLKVADRKPRIGVAVSLLHDLGV